MIRTAKGRALKNAGSGRRWPLIVAGLLGLNFTVVAVTVVCATRDKSFAVEPDYYQKAVQWDRTARERDRAAALGWDVAVTLEHPRADSRPPVLRVALLGPLGADGRRVAMDGAQVQVEAFAQARSAHRLTAAAEAVTGGSSGGLYEAEAAVDRPGAWEVRLRIKRGPETLSFVRTLQVPAELVHAAPEAHP